MACGREGLLGARIFVMNNAVEYSRFISTGTNRWLALSILVCFTELHPDHYLMLSPTPLRACWFLDPRPA